MTDAPDYKIDVRRRERDARGYAEEPWVASAVRLSDNGFVAMQFAATAEQAVSRALAYVHEDRQRTPIVVYA